MRILFSLDNYDHATGGAEMSIQALAHQLALRGHEVRVFQRDRSVRTYDEGPIHVHTHPLPTSHLIRDQDLDTIRWNRHWEPLLDHFINETRFDLIVTQNRLLFSTVKVATRRHIPVAVFVRAFSMFCPLQFRSREALTECDRRCETCLPWRMRLKYRFIRRNLGQYEAGLRSATLLIANSIYMRDVLHRFYNLEAEVVYPAIEWKRYESPTRRADRVLFVKPQYVKGLPIFLQIAARMRDTPFLVAGKIGRHTRRKFRGLDNVECLGWVKHMKDVYARTRVLLGPSIWPEPFGRVFVEAAANGIPSIASARGGIPEAVGKGGILIKDIFDSSRWVEALRRLENPTVYAICAENAYAHAKKFTAAESLNQFIRSVHKAIGLEL